MLSDRTIIAKKAQTFTRKPKPLQTLVIFSIIRRERKELTAELAHQKPSPEMILGRGLLLGSGLVLRWLAGFMMAFGQEVSVVVTAVVGHDQ